MGLRDTFRAALAGTDGEADPQARDERRDAWGTTLDVDRQLPERGDIDDWTEEYEENVLIRKPTQTFTSDVLEPGYRAVVGDKEDDEDPPKVTGYVDDEFNGLRLDEALEKWLSQAGIVDGEYNKDFTDVLDKHLKDKLARRGTAMVEVAYDNPEEKNRIMGLRPFKVETVTAYTLEGKSILLRPDDSAEEVAIEADRTGRIGEGTRDNLPKTRADETACYVQYDDIFGTREDDEVRLSQTDVVKDAYDADTGEVFGLPDTASVYDRAKSIREQYKDLDQALKAVAYSHFIATVDTDSEKEAKKLLSGFDPSNPEKVNVINYSAEVDHYSGEIPEIDDTLKQEIEYILSAFPVPLYRIGFETGINRDVTSEQGDDYQRELSDWRDNLEKTYKSVIQRKADEFMGGDAPDASLEIRPEKDENPLHDEEFDASEFQTTMQGLKQAGVILPSDVIVETFLGLDPDEVLEDMGETMDEADPAVREGFRQQNALPENGSDSLEGAEPSSDAELGSRYSEGDFVNTPDGKGLVSAVVNEGTVDGMDAEKSPVYVVAYLDEADHDFYRAGDLESAESPDVEVDDPEAKLAEFDIESALLSGFDYPPSWDKSDTPNRVILLDAWSSMNGQFDCGGGCCMGEIGSERICASIKDKVLGTESWRGGWAD